MAKSSGSILALHQAEDWCGSPEVADFTAEMKAEQDEGREAAGALGQPTQRHLEGLNRPK